MSSDIRGLLERMSAIEADITPVGVKSGLNAQQRKADQLPALFRPHKIRALGSKTDPQHPMKGMAVGASESLNSGLAEAMAEIEEDMLSKVKKDLNAYLDQLAKKASDDGRREPGERGDKLGQRDSVDRDLVANAARPVNEIFADQQPEYAEGNGITADQLYINDDVVITGPVQYQGATGIIDSFGRDKRFVVVNLYNHGKHSFHSSDVEGNDYAGSEDEEQDLDRRYGRDDVQEDPTQQELTVEPPTPPIQNPTLPESRPVRVVALEDGTIMEIHGDDQRGYEIRRGHRCMPTRFPKLDLAEMVLDLYRDHHRDQSGNQDYIEER